MPKTNFSKVAPSKGKRTDSVSSIGSDIMKQLGLEDDKSPSNKNDRATDYKQTEEPLKE